MQSNERTRLESTDTNSKSATTTETAPYVCTRDGCFAAFGTTSARDDHEDSDHDDEEAEVAA